MRSTNAGNLRFSSRGSFIASGDLLAVEGYYRAKARHTGLVAESDWVMVWHFQNGKCTRFQEYTDTAVLAKALTAKSAAA